MTGRKFPGRGLTLAEAGRRWRALSWHERRRYGATSRLARELAAEYGYSMSGAKARIEQARRYALPRPEEEYRQVLALAHEGLGTRAIAGRLYLGETSVRAALCQARDEGLLSRARSSYSREKALKLAREGHDAEAIAAAVGCCEQVAARMLRELVRAGNLAAPPRSPVRLALWRRQREEATARHRQWVGVAEAERRRRGWKKHPVTWTAARFGVTRSVITHAISRARREGWPELTQRRMSHADAAG